MRTIQDRLMVSFSAGTIAGLAILFVAPVSAQEQATDTTFLNRNIRQQMFLVDYLKENGPEGPRLSAEEVDLFITEAQEAWAQTRDTEDPLVEQFNPYVVMWLFHMVYSDTDLEAQQQAECHAYAEHAVPAFLADFERYRTVSPAHAPLIRWGYDWVGGSLAFRCDIEAPDWNKLNAAFERAPSLYQEYLDAEAYPQDRIAEQIKGAQGFFEKNAPLYAIRDALYRGDLDEAFSGLAAAVTQGHRAAYLLALGEDLWRAYVETGRTDHALGTLDLLARTLTAGDLPRDSLRNWYATVEPDRGPDRFALMTASAPPALIPSGEHAPLNGIYADLLLDESIDLATLDGRLVLLDFWATWCSPCIEEIPHLRTLLAEHGDRVAFVSVNADGVTGGEGQEGVRAFMDKHGVDYPVLFDEPDRSLAARFGVVGYPMKFLISPEGSLLVHPSEGRRSVSLADVETYLEGLR